MNLVKIDSFVEEYSTWRILKYTIKVEVSPTEIKRIEYWNNGRNADIVFADNHMITTDLHNLRKIKEAMRN